MNLELWPTLATVAGAAALTYGTRRTFSRYGSPQLALLAVVGLVLSITGWVSWPEAHRTGVLDFIPATLHDVVHWGIVAITGFVGWRAADG